MIILTIFLKRIIFILNNYYPNKNNNGFKICHSYLYLVDLVIIEKKN